MLSLSISWVLHLVRSLIEIAACVARAVVNAVTHFLIYALRQKINSSENMFFELSLKAQYVLILSHACRIGEDRSTIQSKNI